MDYIDLFREYIYSNNIQHASFIFNDVPNEDIADIWYDFIINNQYDYTTTVYDIIKNRKIHVSDIINYLLLKLYATNNLHMLVNYQYILDPNIFTFRDSKYSCDLLSFCILNKENFNIEHILSQIVHLFKFISFDKKINLLQLCIDNKIQLDIEKIYESINSRLYNTQHINGIYDILFSNNIKLTSRFVTDVFKYNDENIMELFIKYNIDIIKITKIDEIDISILSQLMQKMNIDLCDYLKIINLNQYSFKNN
jgi:hypothetical protein